MQILNESSKCYVGSVEAWEYCLERNIDKLPRKGQMVLTVHAIASGKANEIIGKDKQGYYLAEENQ